MYCSVCKQNHDGSACPVHYDQDMPIYNEAMDVEEQLKSKIATLEAEVKEKDETISALKGEITDKRYPVDYSAYLLCLEERDGFRNGQLQMQDTASDLQDTIEKYAKERKERISENERLREALEKILKVYEPYNIYGFIGPRVLEIAQAALKGEKEAKP